MNSRSIIFSVLHFILYVLVQGALAKDLMLFGYAYCYVYVVFLLLLPFEIMRRLGALHFKDVRTTEFTLCEDDSRTHSRRLADHHRLL